MAERTTTTIEITKENWQQLNALKQEPGEAFNDVLTRLLVEE